MTPDLLRAATSSSRASAELYAPYLTEACAAYNILTPHELAAFLAQLAHESGSLRYVREIADGSAYEGRVDLGNTEPGDGVRFAGRGLIQLTGRKNAQVFRDAMRERFPACPDFEADPVLLEEPKWACWSAAWFWDDANLSGYADGTEAGFIKIGRAINRGNANSPKPANHEPERLARWAAAKAAVATYGPALPETPASEPSDAPQAPSPEKPMASFSDIVNSPATRALLGLVNPLLAVVPEVAKIFMDKDGTTVPERNVAAAVKIAEVAQQSLQAAGKPASNMQEVVETIAVDPQAKAIVRAAVIDQCMSLVEAGGGGIDGARKADAATSSRGDMLHSPSFWVTMVLIPLVYMVVGSVVGLWGKEWPSDVRAAIATAVVSLIIGGAAGYYWGQTTSRNRTPQTTN